MPRGDAAGRCCAQEVQSHNNKSGDNLKEFEFYYQIQRITEGGAWQDVAAFSVDEGAEPGVFRMRQRCARPGRSRTHTCRWGRKRIRSWW